MTFHMQSEMIPTIELLIANVTNELSFSVNFLMTT